MATYPRQNLVRDCLLEIGILDPNESPAAEDYVAANAIVQQRLEGLYEEGLIPFNLDGAVPARFMRPLVKVIAAELMAAYGVQSRAELTLARSAEGMRDLWALRDQTQIDATTRAAYF
jgi:hypothetical protein